MSSTPLATENLKLVPQTREQVLAFVDQMPLDQRAAVSPVWRALVESSRGIDPWLHGFVIVQHATGATVGQCGFKGPPDADGIVEIAYGIAPEHQGKGYATEAAAALVRYAFASGQVRVARAHTAPEPNASTRVLTKCGFRHLGEVIDPEDGLVWRWEKTMNPPND